MQSERVAMVTGANQGVGFQVASPETKNFGRGDRI